MHADHGPDALHCIFADLNVPLDKEQKITDDTRIRAAVPTLKYLLDKGAKVLLTSHLVRLVYQQQNEHCAGSRGSHRHRPQDCDLAGNSLAYTPCQPQATGSIAFV